MSYHKYTKLLRTATSTTMMAVVTSRELVLQCGEKGWCVDRRRQGFVVRQNSEPPHAFPVRGYYFWHKLLITLVAPRSLKKGLWSTAHLWDNTDNSLWIFYIFRPSHSRILYPVTPSWKHILAMKEWRKRIHPSAEKKRKIKIGSAGS